MWHRACCCWARVLDLYAIGAWLWGVDVGKKKSARHRLRAICTHVIVKNRNLCVSVVEWWFGACV